MCLANCVGPEEVARLPVEVSVEIVTDLRLLVVNWH